MEFSGSQIMEGEVSVPEPENFGDERHALRVGYASRPDTNGASGLEVIGLTFLLVRFYLPQYQNAAPGCVTLSRLLL